ncbi:MAG: S8 family serine peptidase, partial [Cyanobacteriota bacterium]|nr:S8 family serine peptidase [Cyanobacteriota bacterium]
MIIYVPSRDINYRAIANLPYLRFATIEGRDTREEVVIGIVDDGVEHEHIDLQGNYRYDLSYDFNDDDTDASPAEFETEDGEIFVDRHGTSVAGVAAASGNNDEGVTGVAPNAGIAGLK